MKNFFSIILILAVFLFFNGCVAMDIVDVFTEETPVHYSEVERITIGKDKKTLYFVDGYNYEVNKGSYIEPGDKVKIFDRNGEFFAEAD